MLRSTNLTLHLGQPNMPRAGNPFPAIARPAWVPTILCALLMDIILHSLSA